MKVSSVITLVQWFNVLSKDTSLCNDYFGSSEVLSKAAFSDYFGSRQGLSKTKTCSDYFGSRQVLNKGACNMITLVQGKV